MTKQTKDNLWTWTFVIAIWVVMLWGWMIKN